MAGTITWRRRAALIAVAALATVALGACGKSGSKGNSGSNETANGQLGSAPTGAATPGASATAGPPATTGSGGGGNTAPTYPTTAKAYAQALLKAWANKNYTRLDQLAITSAVQQIKDSITYGGLPNANWHYLNCQGAAGATYCTFRNDNGDETVIRLNNSQIGHPTAVTEAPLSRTEFPADASAYVNNFIDAWQQGNQQRMLAYANQSVVNFVTHYTPLAGSQICPPDGAAGSQYLTVKGLGDSAGALYLFRLTSEVLARQGKHAITSASIPASSPC